MKYTDNYHFDLYEPGDNANLMDGYNHTVQMIDAVLQQFAALITTQGNAIKAYDTRISQLETSCSEVEKRMSDIEADHASYNKSIDNLDKRVDKLEEGK